MSSDHIIVSLFGISAAGKDLVAGGETHKVMVINPWYFLRHHEFTKGFMYSNNSLVPGFCQQRLLEFLSSDWFQD